MNAKYDKAPARKLSVPNETDAVTGTRIVDKVALDVSEADKSVNYLLQEILYRLEQIDKNLKLINEISFEKEL